MRALGRPTPCVCSQDVLELLRDELDDAIDLFREDQSGDRPTKLMELLLYQPMPYLENHLLPVFSKALRTKSSSMSWAEWVESQHAKHEASRAAARARAEVRAGRTGGGGGAAAGAAELPPTQQEVDGSGGAAGAASKEKDEGLGGLMGLVFTSAVVRDQHSLTLPCRTYAKIQICKFYKLKILI